MPQDALHFRQPRPTLQHPPRQAVTQHMGGDAFQPSRKILQRLAVCDVPLTLCLGTQLLRCQLSQLLNRSLRDSLADA